MITKMLILHFRLVALMKWEMHVGYSRNRPEGPEACWVSSRRHVLPEEAVPVSLELSLLSELFCPGSELSPRPMSVRGPPAYLSVSSRATLVYTSRLMDDGDYTRGGVERGECECGLRVRTLRPHPLRNSVCLKRDPNPRERERGVRKTDFCL